MGITMCQFDRFHMICTSRISCIQCHCKTPKHLMIFMLIMMQKIARNPLKGLRVQKQTEHRSVWDQRSSSIVHSTCCACRGDGCSSQKSHAGSQSSLAIVPEHLPSSFYFPDTRLAHGAHTYYASKTVMHIKLNIF